MKDLLIISAGKGSRMNSKLPKILFKTKNNKTNLENLIIDTKEYFKNIYLIIDKSQEQIFKKQKNIKLICINSGLGSGHAILEGIKKINKISSDITIIWGDAIITDKNILKEIINYKMSDCSGIIPVKQVKNPYVCFKITEDFICSSVDFSKYGEINKNGLQDLCIFRFKTKILKKQLQEFHNNTFKNNYITISKEFEFLYIIHSLYNSNKKIKCFKAENPNSILSYNSKTELKNIINNIKWL